MYQIMCYMLRETEGEEDKNFRIHKAKQRALCENLFIQKVGKREY